MARYLGGKYTVESSKGHVRDLPDKQFGVDIEAGFVPHYEASPGKRSLLKSLKKQADSAPVVFLAPDPDREGEAIAWHLKEALDLPEEKVRRISFDEFTEHAIIAALASPGEIRMDLVNAQQARRILDRIVGYQISPLLWKKVAKGLSAGRVQSVAVRLIVEREVEIREFEARPQSEKEYWKITVKLHHPDRPDQVFQAELKTADKKEIKTEQQAQSLLEEIAGQSFVVSSVEAKEERRLAPPPFSTDLMLQQASTQLGFSTRKTGMIAQQLYEGVEIGEEGPTGLITYMRTDSYNLSAAAVGECRDFIRDAYGSHFVPDRPNVFRAGKRAQEAHEAIRPTDVRRTPEAVKSLLTRDQFRLYELIWKRFVACQMPPARYRSTVVEIAAGQRTFVARGRQLLFEGYLKVSGQSQSEDDQLLPLLATGDPLVRDDLAKSQHFEQPPSRYTEATLVQALKRLGIGRPSTYSPIITTIQTRKYVQLAQRRFHATALGEAVTERLVKYFPRVLDVKFTSKMEDELDEIAEGRLDWKEVLKDFYDAFSVNLAKAKIEMEKATEESPYKCPNCAKPMLYRFSQGGRFLGCSGYPECRTSLPVDAEGKPVERAAPVQTDKKCPKCGSTMVIRDGRRGRFLACSAYPKCRSTLPLDDAGNPVDKPQPIPTDKKCPKCGSAMVIRSGRRGQFLSCSAYPKCKTTAELDDQKETAQTEGPQPVKSEQKCPNCGADMAVRSGPRGRFLACSAYPTCKTTQALKGTAAESGAPRSKPKSTGVPCPEGCGGELVERKGRFGTFFGCSNYPKCKYTGKELPESAG